jgi:DNA processing protein
MGVPGPVTSAPSAGVHQLIRARDAVLVTSGEEVLELVGPMGTFTVADQREPDRPRDRLAPRERQVLDAVPLVQAVDSGSIARTAGIAHVRTKEALLVLHREGLVEHSLGRWRLAGDPAGPSAGSVPPP